MKRIILIFLIIVQIISANALNETTSTIHSHEHTHIQADTHLHEHQHLESNSLTFFFQDKEKLFSLNISNSSFISFYKEKPQTFPSSIFRPPIS